MILGPLEVSLRPGVLKVAKGQGGPGGEPPLVLGLPEGGVGVPQPLLGPIKERPGLGSIWKLSRTSRAA